MPNIETVELIDFGCMLEIATTSDSESRAIANRIASRPLQVDKPTRAEVVQVPRYQPQGGVLEIAIGNVIAPLVDRMDRVENGLNELRESVADLLPAGDRLWSYSQVAEKLNVKPATVRSWVHLGRIKTIESNGKRRVPDSEVRRLILNANRP